MEIFTIGFTHKSAEEFFGLLTGAGIRHLLDIRLHNSSQLSGFTKQADLAYFLREICAASYERQPSLAPTAEILNAYRQDKDWEAYEHRFHALLCTRRAETLYSPESLVAPTVLLCSEPKADHCHRRLVAEYWESSWGSLQIIHL
ncbi:MAG: DUF488 domain-containing protein [Coprothermobacterota bacterium]|nr:DUF488 domain-containing protein [Coprothermobacterota bacterium]